MYVPQGSILYGIQLKIKRNKIKNIFVVTYIAMSVDD